MFPAGSLLAAVRLLQQRERYAAVSDGSRISQSLGTCTLEIVSTLTTPVAAGVSLMFQWGQEAR